MIVQLRRLIDNSSTYCLVCQHFHKLHHTYKQPTAFSVTAIHPVEFLNIQAVYISPMFTVPMYAREYTNKIFWYGNIFEKRWEIFLKSVYCDKIFLAIFLMIKYNILKNILCFSNILLHAALHLLSRDHWPLGDQLQGSCYFSEAGCTSFAKFSLCP